MSSEQQPAGSLTPNMQTHLQAPDCTLCRQLMGFLSGTISEPYVEISEADFAPPCPGHSPLIEGLQQGVEFMRDRELYKRSSFVKAALMKDGPGKEVGISFQPYRDRGYFLETCMVLLHRPDIPGHGGRGRRLDPQWVDLDMVYRWQRLCRTLHEETCDNPLGIARAEPTWLVDLETKCLVSGLGDKDYIALSYRWGTRIGFRTTTDTLAEIQRPQALSTESEIWPLIPATVRHAMGLIERLGYRYFYVDALCVPQNDETTKIHEIGQMAAIFSTAVVTIVATDGDASDGIYGLYDISKPRNLKQTIYPFTGGESVIETDSWLNETCLQGEYASRGWTFQEYHMSKRRIIFSEGRVNWECACAIWREDQMPPVESDNSPRQTRESFSLPKILHGFPSTREYQNFLVGYSSCRLTYEEDSLPAISGTLSLMARTFVGGFLCGIPEMYFDICIIWVSSDCQSALRRPRGDEGVGESSGRNKLESLCPPTWSWIGWKGPFIHWGGTDEYVVQDHARWDYKPIIDWYTSESASGPWRRVESHWYDYVQGARDPEWQPPKGWTKAPYEPAENNDDTDGPIKPPEGLGKFAFKHPSFPDTDFFCPFPLADSDQSPPRPDLVRGTPFLSCRAQRIYLAPSGRKGYEPQEAVFQDENGSVIGTLQPNNKEYWFALFDGLGSDPDSESTASPSGSTEEDTDLSDEPLQVAPKDPMALGVNERGMPIELVAILHARCGTSSRFDETPVYFALWVEWEENIAYRKGLAEVSVEFWNLQNVEGIELVLR